MPIKYLMRKSHQFKQIPLWQQMVVIFLVVAMPLFFSFARKSQLQNALMATPPAPQQNVQVQTQNQNK
jgi:hypothetical protein